MKLAHVVIVTPNKCGLYETARETVVAERALGADARMYDPAPTVYYPKTAEDRGALLAGKEWLNEADVIIDHSGCDGSTDNIQTPHVLIAHGRPRHSFISEATEGQPKIYSYWHRLNRTPKYKAVVTYWPQHVPYLKSMFKDKPVHVINPPCDLKQWSNEGPSGYQFHGHRGKYNLVISDAWRDDSDPYHAITLAILVGRMLPGTKLHIYNKPDDLRGFAPLLNQAKEEGLLGEVVGRISGLDNVYRAANVVLSCNEIATRTVREAMACGCPVRYPTQGAFHITAESIVAGLPNHAPEHRKQVRRDAEMRFNPLDTAKALLEVAERAVG